jgi:hypothetical protein
MIMCFYIIYTEDKKLDIDMETYQIGIPLNYKLLI